jgi:hypothetical protein
MRLFHPVLKGGNFFWGDPEDVEKVDKEGFGVGFFSGGVLPRITKGISSGLNLVPRQGH